MSSTLVSGKAYRLYRREFDAYLERARGVLRTPELTPEVADEMRRNFHRLRGSSGFFGLKDVEAMAKELEELFSHEIRKASEELDRVKSVVDELAQAYRDLEIPGAPPEKE